MSAILFRRVSRLGRHRLPDTDRQLIQRWGMQALGVGALMAAFGLAAVQGPGVQRPLVLVFAAASVMLMGWHTDAGVRIALLALPFVGFIRRVTSGPSGYVLNDPLALLPVALMIPAALFLPTVIRDRTGRLFLMLAAWLVLGEGFGVVQGLSVQTAVYGAATAVVPVIVAGKAASGTFDTLPRFLVRVLPASGAVVGLYGIYQWVSPPQWDLAWLTTQQAALTSVGFPEVGQFRIWATTESPGIAALFLGAAACVAFPLAIRRSTPAWYRIALAGMLVPTLFSLILTEARTGLFAIPLAVGAAAVVDRQVRKVLLLPMIGVLVVVAVVIPPLLSSTASGRARYDVANIGADESFQDRQQLLPQFAAAVTSRPLGNGSGSTQLGQRLGSAGGVTTGGGNIDNGYLTRVIETGVPGFALFGVLVTVAFVELRRRRRGGALTDVDIASFSAAVFFLLTDASGPSTNGTLAILFWICLGHLARPTAGAGVRAGSVVVHRVPGRAVTSGPTA